MCAPGTGITGEGPGAPDPQGMPTLAGLEAAATSAAPAIPTPIPLPSFAASPEGARAGAPTW